MPVGHGAWKASEPLSDLDQLLSIVKHDPNVTASRWLVSATLSSGLCTLCPTPPIRGARGETLRRGPDGSSLWCLKTTMMFFEISVEVAIRRLILSGEHAVEPLFLKSEPGKHAYQV